MIYQFRDGSRVSGVAPEVAGKRLEQLRRRKKGRITPEDVVEDARPEEAPLHPVFEWDNATAAEEYRKEQARHLIRAIVVKYEGDAEDRPAIRAFVHVPMDGQQFYASTTDALSDESMRRVVMTRALMELAAWERRYQELRELASVFEAASAVREQIAS